MMYCDEIMKQGGQMRRPVIFVSDGDSDCQIYVLTDARE